MSKWRAGSLVIVAACSSQAAEQRDHRDGGEPAPVDAAPDGRLPCPFHQASDVYGDARVELVHHPDGTTAARATVFVYEDPGSVKFFQFANLAGCTDLTSDQYWPTATNPIAERIYRDPGDVLISGGADVLTVPRQTTQGVDVLGREHPAGAWFAHDAGPTANDAAQYLTPEAHHDIILTGSTNLSGQVLSDAVYVPPTFDLVSPGIDPVAVPSSQAMTFTFSAPAASPPPAHEVYESVIFSGAQGPVVMCIDWRDGSVTVPSNIVDLVRTKLPDGGTLTRQAMVITDPELDDGAPELVNGCPAAAHVILTTTTNGYESPFTIAP